MAISLRRRLEDAVIAALKGLPYLRGARPYNGEMADPERVREALAGFYPGVLVATDDGAYRGLSVQQRRWTEEIKLELLVCSGNLRGREAQVRGDSRTDQKADPGIYAMLEDVRDQLAGVELDVDGVGVLVPVSVTRQIHLADLSVWRATYSADADAVAKEPTRATITEVAGDFNVPSPDDAANPVIETTNTVV